jgi:hypothetical protein
VNNNRNASRGNDSSYGANIVGGNTLPPWLLHNREFREVHEARFCFWTVMA